MTLLFALGCALSVESAEQSFSEEGPFTGLDVVITAGSVTVSGMGDTTQISGDLTANFSGAPPSLSRETTSDGVLHLESICPEESWLCEVNAKISAPSTLDVSVATGSGDVTIVDVRGNHQVSTGSGDLELRGAGGTAVLETGSGDVSLIRGDFSALELITGSGDFSADLLTVPGILVAETGSGDIELLLPGGAYAITTETGSGDIRIGDDITVDPQAASVIELLTGSGDIVVRAQ